jgi:hypothetical protein
MPAALAAVLTTVKKFRLVRGRKMLASSAKPKILLLDLLLLKICLRPKKGTFWLRHNKAKSGLNDSWNCLFATYFHLGSDFFYPT